MLPLLRSCTANYVGLHFLHFFLVPISVSLASGFSFAVFVSNGWCPPGLKSSQAAPELSGVAWGDDKPCWVVCKQWKTEMIALSPSHTCTGQNLRTDCFSIHLESPYPLKLLDLLRGGGPLGFVDSSPASCLSPPQVRGTCQSHLVFTGILRAYLLWTCSWMKSVLVQWLDLKSDLMAQLRTDAVLLKTSV